MEKDNLELELNNEDSQKEERSLFNPETTFCEGQTYLDFLMANAKDDEEKAKIEDTINNYLEVFDNDGTSDEKEKDED